MSKTGDGAATPVDLIEDALDKIEHLLALIRARAQELKEGGDGETGSGTR